MLFKVSIKKCTIVGSGFLLIDDFLQMHSLGKEQYSSLYVFFPWMLKLSSAMLDTYEMSTFTSFIVVFL